MLFSLLFGFLTSCIPSIFKLVQDFMDKKQEYNLALLQIQISKDVQNERLAEIGMQLDLDSLKTRYATFYSGNKVADFVNSLVRPSYAYAFLFIYIIIDIIYYYHLKDCPPGVFYDLMWTENDENLMGTIIGFYFGSRANEKIRI